MPTRLRPSRTKFAGSPIDKTVYSSMIEKEFVNYEQALALKSDINKRENPFGGELTPDNIYKYYLEQTGDEKEAEKLLDKLIKEIDKLIKKGNK